MKGEEEKGNGRTSFVSMVVGNEKSFQFNKKLLSAVPWKLKEEKTFSVLGNPEQQKSGIRRVRVFQ